MISQWLTKIKNYPVNPTLPSCLAIAGGRHIHMAPVSGSDQGREGKSPDKSVQTLLRALALATANQNDIAFFHSEGNASAACTDYQAAALNWNKDLVHLIGQNSGGLFSQRSRIAFKSDYDTAAALFTLSANGCRLENLQFFAGVAGTTPLGAVLVTGDRNVFKRCHFAGIGAAANDIAGAYSLKLDGAEENVFEECVIGLQTMARGAQLNADLLFDTASKNNVFRNCIFVSEVSHASNHVLVEVVDATGIDGFNIFENCLFLYQSANYAVGATGVMRLPALTQGYLVVKNCGARSDASGTTIKWDVNDRDRIILIGAATPAADTADVGRLV